MSWLSTRNSDKDSVISNSPIKRVQAYRILGLEDEDEEEMTEDQKIQMQNTLTLFESGLIDTDTAREMLKLKRFY